MATNIIVWSDLQAHPWHEDISPKHWEKTVLGCIKFVFEYTAKTQADYLVFNGDLFESKRVRIDVMSAVLDTIDYWSKQCSADRLAVAGNHDVYGKYTTVNLMRGFRAITDPITILGSRVLLVPHHTAFTHGMQHTAAYSADWQLAITHDDIKGSDQGHLITAQLDGIDPAVIKQAGNRGAPIFNGHYHHRHEFKRGGAKIVNYGACMYHDWSDLDDTLGRGLCHITVDDDRVSWKYVNYKCPRFLSREMAKKLQSAQGEDFVQVIDFNNVSQDAETLSHENVAQVASFDTKVSVEAYLRAEGVDPQSTYGRMLYQTGVKLLREKS